VRYKLPVEMREPVLQRLDPAAQPIMQLALSSDGRATPRSRGWRRPLADRFRGIPGVAVVNVNGALRRELSVLLQAEKLREYGVSVTEVVAALRAQNATAPVGKVRGGWKTRASGWSGASSRPPSSSRSSSAQWHEVLRLGQLATVQGRLRRAHRCVGAQRHPNVGLSVTRTREASTVGGQRGMRKLVADINKDLPAGTKLEITQDGGEDAEAACDNVIHALVFGAD
jgi:HAE1 family hydrophobic/amphiphilic exporter-1